MHHRPPSKPICRASLPSVGLNYHHLPPVSLSQAYRLPSFFALSPPLHQKPFLLPRRTASSASQIKTHRSFQNRPTSATSSRHLPVVTCCPAEKTLNPSPISPSPATHPVGEICSSSDLHPSPSPATHPVGEICNSSDLHPLPSPLSLSP